MVGRTRCLPYRPGGPGGGCLKTARKVRSRYGYKVAKTVLARDFQSNFFFFFLFVVMAAKATMPFFKSLVL